MHEILHSLAHFFYALGGVGLVLLGTLDSSFLMLPLGNDLLVVALTAHHPETDVRLEYSPESFTGTELDFARDVCEAVMDVWEPAPDGGEILRRA